MPSAGFINRGFQGKIGNLGVWLVGVHRVGFCEQLVTLKPILTLSNTFKSEVLKVRSLNLPSLIFKAAKHLCFPPCTQEFHFSSAWEKQGQKPTLHSISCPSFIAVLQ